MSHETYRWMLLQDFVDNFNEHRATTFNASDLICVDESMSRWYGLGGVWINMGLPMYIAMDRKPDNGCKIQNAACARSGVMLCLKLVKSAVQEAQGYTEGDVDDSDNTKLPHGGKVLLELTQPFFHTPRIICADSYFASVAAADALLQVGLRFIGMVKTSNKRFPHAWLKQQEMAVRGDRIGLVRRDSEGQPTMHAICVLDKDRQYMISTTSSMQEGKVQERTRWRQLDDTANSDPAKVDVSIVPTLIAECFFSASASIDQHNRARQNDLKLEKKLQTHDWSKRVALSILGMIIVDTWNVYSQATCRATRTLELEEEAKNVFFIALAEEMIENTIDNEGVAVRKKRCSTDSTSTVTGPVNAVDGSGIRLVRSKRPKNVHGQIVKGQAASRRCRTCRTNTTVVCSKCLEQGVPEHIAHYCKPGSTNKLCFAQHLQQAHPPINTED
jgi:hypothetical protein